MKKRAILLLFIVLCFYLSLSLWRLSFTPFNSHPDGCWYHTVAKNWADDRGLIEDTVIGFYPQPQGATHPISTYWNPLSILILGISYKILGVSDFAARLPVLIVDSFVVIFIFLFCLKVFSDLKIAFLSSLIFATHKFIIGQRMAGGAPESFHLFFVTLFCFLTALSARKIVFAYIASLVGGLAYLVRNESFWALPVLLIVLWLNRRDKKLNPWHFAGVVGIFAVAILPWEIRNFLIYGSQANWPKYSLLFAREYFDIWSSHFEPTGLLWFLKNYLSLGLVKILIVKFQSFYYKLDLVMTQIWDWPIILFLVPGIVKNIKQREFYPACIYFVLTYLIMGFLNSASQGGGWHAPGALLAFVIPLAVSGCYWTATLLAFKKQRVAKVGAALAGFIFFYHLADNYRQYRLLQKIGFQNTTAVYTSLVGEFVKKDYEDAQRPTLMSHNPQYLNFYTGFPAVQIPTNDSWEDVKGIMRKYNCQYLVLYGTIPQVFARLYLGEETIEGLSLVYEKIFPALKLEGAGDRIKIYRIDL